MHPLNHTLWPSFVPNQYNLYGSIIADVAATLTWPVDIPPDSGMCHGVWHHQSSEKSSIPLTRRLVAGGKVPQGPHMF